MKTPSQKEIAGQGHHEQGLLAIDMDTVSPRIRAPGTDARKKKNHTKILHEKSDFTEYIQPERPYNETASNLVIRPKWLDNETRTKLIVPARFSSAHYPAILAG